MIALDQRQGPGRGRGGAAALRWPYDGCASDGYASGTAYLRLDLLPEGAHETMQARFRRYLNARVEGYRKLLVLRHSHLLGMTPQVGRMARNR